MLGEARHTCRTRPALFQPHPSRNGGSRAYLHRLIWARPILVVRVNLVLDVLISVNGDMHRRRALISSIRVVQDYHLHISLGVARYHATSATQGRWDSPRHQRATHVGLQFVVAFRFTRTTGAGHCHSDSFRVFVCHKLVIVLFANTTIIFLNNMVCLMCRTVSG